MTISEELEAKILRYFHVEKWRVGTISRQLNVHHGTIKRVLVKTGNPHTVLTKQPSILEPYLPFVLDTLKKYPKLTASRLYQMVVERGYPGGPDHFRHLVGLHRPRPVAEAYFRLRTLPGEQAQVDWGHFGYVDIGMARRPLMAFVMVLSYSRKIFLRFYLNQNSSSFLDGHVAAFTTWEGVPRVIQYDNLKSAVLERHSVSDAIRFNPLLLSFAAHYRYEPHPVAIARGNEKGRVERSIRYIRENFFAARSWKDLDDLNAQAVNWCESQASNRPCPEDRKKSVREVFNQEKPKLLALPDNPYPIEEKKIVKVGKTPYVRFDLNDYSIPYNHVRRTLTVIAKSGSITPDSISPINSTNFDSGNSTAFNSTTLDSIVIVDGSEVIATHKRSYDKGKQIESETHLQELGEYKKRASKARGQDRLIQAVPISKELLIKAAERSYGSPGSLGGIISVLLQLLDSYGAQELEIAISEALARDVPHPNAVRLCLEKRREKRQESPPIALDLSHNKRVQDLVIRTHDLDDYNQLQSLEETNDNNKNS